MKYIIYFFLAISTIVFSCSRSSERAIQKIEVCEKDSTPSVITHARSLIGKQYKYGGVGPKKFDCSGLVKFVYEKEGITLSGGSRHIRNQVEKTSQKRSVVGDLVFFSNKGKINHVGIISKIENGSHFIIHSTTSQGVMEQEYMKSPYWSKRVHSYGRIKN